MRDDYLLIILKELGDEYQLPEIVLCDYFNCIEEGKMGNFTFKNELNCFSILVLLYYISNNTHYQQIKKGLLSYIIYKIEKTEESKRRKNTELIILLFDLLSCPYITDEYKKKLLALYEIPNDIIQSNILKFQKNQKYWFTKWDKVNLEKELNAKICQEVYS